jgi:hypothetical protein
MENLGNELHKEPVNMETDKFYITFNEEFIVYEKNQCNETQEDNEIITDNNLKSYIETIMQPKIKNIIQITRPKYFIEYKESNDKEVYDTKCETIIWNIEKGKTSCKLDPDYIKYSLSSCHAVITLERNPNEIITFATIYVTIDAPKILYIDVLCSNEEKYRGGGTLMIDKIKDICKKLLIREIKLSSVTTALGFYTKKNFECDELCNLKLEVNEPSNNKIGGIHKKTQKRRKNRTQKRRKSQNMKKKK